MVFGSMEPYGIFGSMVTFLRVGTWHFLQRVRAVTVTQLYELESLFPRKSRNNQITPIMHVFFCFNMHVRHEGRFLDRESAC